MSIRLSKASKMPCPSWSLEALTTCPGSKKRDGTLVDACKGCYATQGNYRFPNVKAPRLENQEDWKREDWVQDMVQELDNHRYFRWFDSGDMYHIKLAHKMLEVMAQTPWVKHWLPTRMHKFAKFASVINAMEALPNVIVRLSSDSIHGEIIEGDTTSTIIGGLVTHETLQEGKLVKTQVFEGVVPEGVSLCRAFERKGKCGTCRACWDKDTKVVAYPAHGRSMIKLLNIAA